MAAVGHLQPGRGLLRTADRDGDRFGPTRRRNCWSRSRASRPVRRGSATTRIPKELERICLKALSKRASERYTTAKDMADDLRHFLAEQTAEQSSLRLHGPRLRLRSRPSRSRLPRRLHQSIQYPCDDADFGPAADQDRAERACGPSMPTTPTSSSNCCPALVTGTGCPTASASGRPGSRKRTPTTPSRVGLIYGPSGCGKSSLVKAGLLPRLSDDVIAVYVEATAEETEARLLNGLRKRCPALARQPGSEGDAGGAAPWAGHSCGQEGADRPRPVRAMAPCEEGRRKHRTGASPAAVRRRPGAVRRHGAG